MLSGRPQVDAELLFQAAAEPILAPVMSFEVLQHKASRQAPAGPRRMGVREGSLPGGFADSFTRTCYSATSERRHLRTSTDYRLPRRLDEVGHRESPSSLERPLGSSSGYGGHQHSIFSIRSAAYRIAGFSFRGFIRYLPICSIRPVAFRTDPRLIGGIRWCDRKYPAK